MFMIIDPTKQESNVLHFSGWFDQIKDQSMIAWSQITTYYNYKYTEIMSLRNLFPQKKHLKNTIVA